MKRQEFHAILVAAGSGTRLGFDIPKAFVPLNGQALLLYALNALESLPQCLSVVIVISKEHEEFWNKLNVQSSKIKIAYGGKTRQDSVHNGIRALQSLKDDDLILVHDAARPFINSELIMNVVTKAALHGAATLVTEMTDTIRDKISGGTYPRENLMAIQTPQVFKAEILRKAHAQNLNATDDAGLVQHLGYAIFKTQGSKTNFKITTADDWEMAEKYLLAQKITKTGLGFDVHAFDDTPATHIRLGGIDIQFSKKLKGHSDADVVLHAICDAIYGALALGDIGFHFPPIDNAHKNKDSAEFLNHAIDCARKKNAKILHIDCTLMCEEPKLTPHREAMRARISEITKLPLSAISLKATTTERLGFTGRGEGIACQALVTIQMTEEQI